MVLVEIMESHLREETVIALLEVGGALATMAEEVALPQEAVEREDLVIV
jgi:hypothetical protein